MSYWVEKLNEIEKQLKEQETALTAECLPGIKLSEFERRDIAVEIYSEVLGCELWLCSNKYIAAQIREDAPGAVCYTVKELRHLLGLNPSPESLKTIHEAKAVFPGSTIEETDKSLRQNTHENLLVKKTI